jgi:2-hydroxychromene-2-carboxylate isomerase
MAAQAELTELNFSDHVSKFARAHKMDPARALAGVEDAALAARVEAEYQEAIARGVSRTPTVLVNGNPFIERFPAADIIQAIERELGAAKP